MRKASRRWFGKEGLRSDITILPLDFPSPLSCSHQILSCSHQPGFQLPVTPATLCPDWHMPMNWSILLLLFLLIYKGSNLSSVLNGFFQQLQLSFPSVPRLLVPLNVQTNRDCLMYNTHPSCSYIPKLWS